MHLFLATATSPWGWRLVNDVEFPNVLVAFPYAKTFDYIDYQPQRVILDSGAFSAWNVGKSVDVKAYAEWVLAMRTRFPNLRAVNLDVIPGEVGRTSTRAERAQGMRRSLANADYLRSQGIDVMEVFHQDEPKAFLDDLCDRLPIGGVLCVSPRNDVNVNLKLAWQNVVLRQLVARFGKTALPRTHGLAVTSRRMLQQFPYYSVDSSTWMSSFRYGTFVNEHGTMVGTERLLPQRPNVKQPAALDATTRRSIENLRQLAESITTLWARRGVQWTD